MARKVSKTKAAMRPRMGWREWVSLPELGVERIKAKVDTGARSSSLHAYDIRVVRKRSGLWIRFKVHPIQRNNDKVVEAIARVLDERTIRSSNGHISKRYVIETDVAIGETRWPIELTLTRRDEMGFRMLLGRQAIRRRFVVDPGLSYLAGKRPVKLKRKSSSSSARKGRDS